MDSGEAARVAEVERVLLRLGLAEDEKLCDILHPVLPQLFQRLIDMPSEAVTNKILEVFSHLVKRLKTFPSMRVQLPLVALLPFLAPGEAATGAYARNFSVLFLELGFANETVEVQSTILSGLLAGLATKTTTVQDAFFRLLVYSLKIRTTISLTLGEAADTEVLLDFLLDVLLFPGVSPARTERLARTKVLALEKSSRTELQLKVVQFVKATVMAAADAALWVLHFATGATADFHTISTYCKEELDRLLKYQLDVLDTPAVMGLVCRSLLGQASDGTVLLADRARLPDAIALQLLPLLCASKAAANAFPMNLQLICTLLFGSHIAAPLAAAVRKAGMDYCVWTLGQADGAMVTAALGPVLCSPLLKLLQATDCAVHVRQGVYASLALLATRCPHVLAASAEPFQLLLYRALKEESAGRTGGACLEALRSLCVAYEAADTAVLATIKRELRELSDAAAVREAAMDRVRGALAFWAARLLFADPADGAGGDMHLRRVLLLFVGDASDQVRELCAANLFRPPLPPFATVVSVLPPTMLSPAPTESVLSAVLQFYVAAAAAESETTLQLADVAAVVGKCLGLLPGSTSASEALVKLSSVAAARPVLRAHLPALVSLLVTADTADVRDHLAVTIRNAGLPAIDALNLVHEMRPDLAGDGPAQLGALAAISALAPTLRLDTTLAATVCAKLQATLTALAAGGALHETKRRLGVAFALAQTLGALAAGDSMADAPLAVATLLGALRLPVTDADVAPAVVQLHLRALQSLACVFYACADRIVAADCARDLVDTYAERKDVAFQFAVGHVLVAMGVVGPCDKLWATIDALLQAPSPHRKASGAVYLLCALVASTSAEAWAAFFAAHAPAVHDRAIDLLNEANAFTQECAVQSLALLYEVAQAPDELSDALFKRLKCFRAFVPTDDAAPANAVENACYREVSAVAAEVGDPAVMYTLLFLSTSDPTWGVLAAPGATGRVSDVVQMPLAIGRLHAAFVAAQAATAQVAWHASEVAAKLVPRLFLLKAHPNPKVAACMLQLWTLLRSARPGLVADHFEALLAHALERAGSKNVRYREAAMAALAELLQGRSAADVGPHLRAVWLSTMRAVDDVHEAVVVASLKLVKVVGELSVRVATADAGCADAVLPFLVDEGIASANKLCQGLCLGYLLRLVQALPPRHLEPHLSTLPLTLLACMSSLELPELQYAQFHVADKRQLEKLRVSLSQAGPVGELLTACLGQLARLATADPARATEVVGALCHGLCGVLRAGVGLNTRVGAANFCVALVTDVPHEMRASGGAEKLLRAVFLPYMASMVLAEARDGDAADDAAPAQEDPLRDGLVVRANGRAAAYVAKLAPPALVAAYVRRALLAVPTSIVFVDGVSTTATDLGRYGWVTATAATELLRQLPSSDAADACQHLFPVAFAGQFAAPPALGAAWTEVLDAVPPTLAYSAQFVAAAVTYATTLVGHLSWEARRQGAVALQTLAGESFAPLAPSWVEPLLVLSAAVPGKLWRGKGVVLEALVAVAARSATDTDALLALLLAECDRADRAGDVAYLESAIVAVGALAPKAPSLAAFGTLRTFFFDEPRSLPPLLFKRMLEALAAWWPPTPVEADAGIAAQAAVLAWLAGEMLATPAYHVWSVREAVFGCLARVVATVDGRVFANRQAVALVVEACLGDDGMRDAKYAAVRKAATAVLVALCGRDGPLPVAVLVYKEDMALAAAALAEEPEPTVCLVASQLLLALRPNV
ncbi:hypothetical protein ACHHYP_03131 [Achlya hypogyna]|uniref:Proteasome-associated protein ECM29 n=1 Tax=Achlya hypogyna TaxID=1202772 RepID=A0A1V9Z4D6_ACHHY|nr:hypothetical protein ACHHYP_03131 [Achlya hypogyna]